MFQYYKDLDGSLAWLTQMTEEPNGNKGDFTLPTQRVNVIEL